jgi:hypothetical protein
MAWARACRDGLLEAEAMSRAFRRFRRQDPPDEPAKTTVEITLAPEPPASPEAAQTFLAEAEVLAGEPIPWGSNYGFVLILQRGDESRLAVYKPRRGEVPLWDFPDGTLYKREYASFLVTRAIGWDFIPPTVIRDGPHGTGTVQLHVDHDPRADHDSYRKTNEGTLMRIFLFDVFANNADRKSGHTLRGRDGRLWAIDHGLTFNTVSKLRTVIWDFCGEPIPREIKKELQDFWDDQMRRDALDSQLRDLLDPSEIATFYARLQRLLKSGKFPQLDPYRNVPRGWW